MQSEVAASSVGLGNDEEVSSSDDEHDENSHFEHDTGRSVFHPISQNASEYFDSEIVATRDWGRQTANAILTWPLGQQQALLESRIVICV